MKKLIFGCVVACASFAFAGEFESSIAGQVKYNETDGWTITPQVQKLADGREKWTLTFAAKSAIKAPRTKIECEVPCTDAVGRWRMWAGDLPPNWASGFSSALHSQVPVVQYFSDSSLNRGTIACSEAFRRVQFKLGVVEETGDAHYEAELFTEDEAPIKDYKVEFLLDFRPIYFADALRGAFRWYETMPEYKPASVPEAAFDPLYSFWYSYHQNVTAAKIEKECAAFAKYGFKNLIVDDGWQTDNNQRGYAYCGDWNVSTNRFADFPAHVKKVQAMGIKYMIWFSVPFVGAHSENFAKFKDKFLRSDDKGTPNEVGVLDPRFPEVREFLINKYVQAVRDWGLDGLKLDFIDAFSLWGEDPAVKQNYAGRDIKAVPEAVDRLMVDIRDRLEAIRPGVLIEFRQGYIGPAMRKYGNMFRASDCPLDYRINRMRTIDLRLTSGNTAVHADMIMWRNDASVEAAAKQFWSILFAVPQVSVRLNELPAAHQAKLKEMIDFWMAHRETLMKGDLHPLRPDMGYPIVYAYGKGEQIVAVYDANQVVKVDRTKGAKVFVVNATDDASLAVEENGKIRRVAMKPCSVTEL